MKLLIDMNLSPRWVEYFHQHGFEAAHWSTIGAMDAPDSFIMAHAQAHDYVVFTHDLDFSAILAATNGLKPSVVQIRGADVRPETIGPVTVKGLRQVAVELESGALLTIDATKARLRILPLA